MNARIVVKGREFVIDLAKAVSLALEVDFTGREPRFFGAPAPVSTPLSMDGFTGAVETGASCNCRTISLTPHCNGTHTECVGHLTREPMDAYSIVPTELLPAVVCTVNAVRADASRESTEPPPRPDDLLVTRGQIEKHWPRHAPFTPHALILRVRAGAASPKPALARGALTATFRREEPASKPLREAPAKPSAPPRIPPFLSREAAQFLVTRGIQHLITDLPSVDRIQDEGKLTAHRVFFGLPPGSTTLREAQRSANTITELADLRDDLGDGWCFVQLQVPAISGDAVPSRPMAYPL